MNPAELELTECGETSPRPTMFHGFIDIFNAMIICFTTLLHQRAVHL